MFTLLLQSEQNPPPAAGQMWRHQASPETNVEVIWVHDQWVVFNYADDCTHTATLEHFQQHFEFAGLVPASK